MALVKEDGSSPVNINTNPLKIEDFAAGIHQEEEGSASEGDLPKYVDLQSRQYDEVFPSTTTDYTIEDATRVNDFLAISLHNENGPVSISFNQDNKNSSESDDSSDSSSSTSSSSEEEDNVQCQICQKIFANSSDLDLHIKSRRMHDKKYKCCNCQKLFRDNTQLKVHARKHTGEKPFECQICGKKFTVNGNMNKHMRIHTGERRFECTDCGKKFTQFAHLEDHMKTHSGDRPFVCSYCQTAFKTKARLRKHEKSHASTARSKRSIGCPQCNIILKNNRQLAAHLATHLQESDGPFTCQLCGKSFPKYLELLEHQKNHSDMTTFFCEFCNRKFASGSHLRRHMNSHSGFKPYKCDICKRPFQSTQNLKRHMMTHTGEKPFDCLECGRKFLTLENLNRHKRTHTGEKPFACEICGRVFAHSTTAKEHYRAVHTGEKPFGCSHCQHSFAVSKMLYRHIRVKHPDHFQQFKMEQAITPNMKKALNKFRGTVVENSGKEEIYNLAAKSRIEEVTLVKEEPVDLEDEESSSQMKTEENSDGLISTKIKREFIDNSDFIKTEKPELEPYN
ncbi:unnamed protein product [Ceutorhynchus assimilis]|uniref:Zinc finger protein 865 n=1 Tax=Ceutorhynchus assimilis TaxID=467358 RepID=A0A9N9MHP9_9CUCU|nr:unnamed protein product [Ceutorhynchus assimilis]